VYCQAPSADANIPQEQRLHVIGHRVLGCIVAIDTSTDGMYNVSDKEDFNIAIISDICDDLILAQFLHDQVVDGMRLVAIQIASEIWR